MSLFSFIQRHFFCSHGNLNYRLLNAHTLCGCEMCALCTFSTSMSVKLHLEMLQHALAFIAVVLFFGHTFHAFWTAMPQLNLGQITLDSIQMWTNQLESIELIFMGFLNLEVFTFGWMPKSIFHRWRLVRMLKAFYESVPRKKLSSRVELQFNSPLFEKSHKRLIENEFIFWFVDLWLRIQKLWSQNLVWKFTPQLKFFGRLFWFFRFFYTALWLLRWYVYRLFRLKVLYYTIVFAINSNWLIEDSNKKLSSIRIEPT